MSSSDASPRGLPSSRGEWLRLQRQAKGWSVPEMRRHLREAAKEAGDTLPSNECLGVMIRRWEKDDGGVSERYRMHYCRAFGISFDDFGTAPLPAGSLSRRILDQVVTAPAAPLPALDEDERAELTRLRRQYAELHRRHRKFRHDLVAWIWKAMDEDKDWELVYPRPEVEP